MCVEVHWIIISDAGSTPATSTWLRFELAKNEADKFGLRVIRLKTIRPCFITSTY